MLHRPQEAASKNSVEPLGWLLAERPCRCTKVNQRALGRLVSRLQKTNL
ncbi:hypothetical protein APY03_0798 [Variovorax sp. WDL1]|nr:hypothetical protein APY03_0798 [Variovorax sp. WDL1]